MKTASWIGSSWSASLHQASYTEGDSPTARSWTGFDTTAVSDCSNCLIRVQGSDGDDTGTDESDAVFVIDNTAPSVQLSAPNGGEVLQGGETYTITWTASDANLGAQPIALDRAGRHLSQGLATPEPGLAPQWWMGYRDSTSLGVRAGGGPAQQPAAR